MPRTASEEPPPNPFGTEYTVRHGESHFCLERRPDEPLVLEDGRVCTVVEFVDSTGARLALPPAHGYFANRRWTVHRAAHFAIADAIKYYDPQVWPFVLHYPRAPREVFAKGFRLVDHALKPIDPSTNIEAYAGTGFFVQLPYEAPHVVKVAQRMPPPSREQ